VNEERPVEDYELEQQVYRAKRDQKKISRKLQAGVRMGGVLLFSVLLAIALVYLIY
jgi:hypothetical protein